MYAAAGGASIASRKARQNKAQIKGAPKKGAAANAKGKAGQPPNKHEKPQSKQFHQLPEGYHSNRLGLAPPPAHLASSTASLHHSRSLNLGAVQTEMRPCRSVHDVQQQEPPSTVGSPPRAYTCTHWESKLLRTTATATTTTTTTTTTANNNTVTINNTPDVFCECAQGKAAWQEAAGAAARRCSVVAEGNAADKSRSKQNEAHLRWMKRNRVHDCSRGGSSSDDEDGMAGRLANAISGLLYVGLGTVALGLVISFVGTGDKGFKTLELRYTGPALICAGLCCCLLRILLCMCPPSTGAAKRAQAAAAASEGKEAAAVERPLLLSEAPYHHHHHHHHHQMRKSPSSVATALMLQHEKDAAVASSSSSYQQFVQQPPPPPPPPDPPPPTPLVMLSHAYEVQGAADDARITTMDGSSVDISSLSRSTSSGSGSYDNPATVVEFERHGRTKLNRSREAANRAGGGGGGASIPRTVTFADTPNIIGPPSEAPPPAAEIVLTPSNLTANRTTCDL